MDVRRTLAVAGLAGAVGAGLGPAAALADPRPDNGAAAAGMHIVTTTPADPPGPTVASGAATSDHERTVSAALAALAAQKVDVSQIGQKPSQAMDIVIVVKVGSLVPEEGAPGGFGPAAAEH